eukprot:TRINITY_DN2793_c0_g1_i8.p1 TRINITY_DN2793_c0_g1~~TRINITY_DN2793_c0_g1_i8.p1  ORF type:complete len:103 (-),score=15.47 TRINITY_DN2793_c0_g1_i8:397-705(-)
MNEEVDHVLKMVFIGDASVGKTSILNRFTEGVFDPEQACTVGVDFKLHVVNARDNIRVKLTIWDTAGQEKFQSLTPSYYRGGHAFFVGGWRKFNFMRPTKMH